ncbi:E3 ubiquitin-protein ligase CCNB1IP1-like [Cimex lectularius]|uniref:RING-type domain-containing protein n=1 Tax=Cimex lectularius TaxID=79782 RepID=A0A8I6RQP5_CIMLE|nr:E3 ubiquitin-protein ligase CCNB1IP1-like [Cimex lectularius]
MDDNLYCNIAKCRRILTDVALVTRCYHIFCLDHGKTYFFNNLPQINCPVCNEANIKETDIIQCQLNPNDLILGGLSPDKAISAVISCIKLRRNQHQASQEYKLAQIDNLNKKLYEYKKAVKQMKSAHNTELSALKSCYNEMVGKLNAMAQDLEIARESAKKYQVAYNSLMLSNQNHTSKFFNCPSPVDSQLFPGRYNSSPLKAHSTTPSLITSDNFLTRHFNI